MIAAGFRDDLMTMVPQVELPGEEVPVVELYQEEKPGTDLDKRVARIAEPACAYKATSSRSARIFPLQPHKRALARGVEPIQISRSPLDCVEVQLIIRVTQVIPEPTDGAPGYLRLMHFRQCTQLDSRLRYLEKAHADGIVDDTLIRQHTLEAAAQRQVVPDLGDIAPDVLVANCGL